MTQDLESKAMNEWKKNVDFFQENKELIKKQYGEEAFVVIKDQQIIDSGDDKFKLGAKYQSQHVLISNYKDSTKIVEISSPEVVR